MQKLTITKIFTKQEQGAKGPYTRMSIKANEFGDKWISGFQNKENAHWKEGDVVEAIIEKKPGVNKQGQAVEYLNFSLPKAEQKNSQELLKIHMLLTGMNLTLLRIAEKLDIDMPGKVSDYSEEDINAEDIPF